MVIKLNESKLNDVVSKVKSVHDYALGKRHDTLGNLKDASDGDIRTNSTLSSIVKEFDRSNAPYEVQVDKVGKKLVLKFNATKVPSNLVDKFKGEYDRYVHSYDPKDKEVMCIFDMNTKVTESVMNPTPTPYKFKSDVSDFVPISDEVDEEVLSEDLEMSDPEPRYSESKEDYYLSLEINGRDYKFFMKEDSPYSIDQMYNKVLKMMGFSKGKALAFLKKHMVGTRSVTESDEDRNDQEFEIVDTKRVRDVDGFLTDYIWIKLSDGTNQFFLVDKDYFEDPTQFEPDWETDSDAEAQEWYDNYDEDEVKVDESVVIKESIYDNKNKVLTYDQARQYAKMNYTSGGADFYETWEEYQFDDYVKLFGPMKVKDMDALFRQYRDDDHYEDESLVLEVKSGNSFKSSHVCQGCGKPIGECTCDVEEDEVKVDESLNEKEVVPETYKSIKIELSDPDSQLEELIKFIKVNSDPGHTFSVVVDPDDSEKSNSFTIDGDGSFRISSIEIKDEIEDKEVKEESLKESFDDLSIDDLKKELKYRQSNYDKLKHDHEIHKDKDNNDVLSREDKMLVAKFELDKIKDEISRRSLGEEYHLGDEVVWKGQNYVIVDSDTDEDHLIVLRPVDKFSSDDFDEPEFADASDDVFLDRSQLEECIQPSSIGGHKVDSIDMIPNDKCKLPKSEESEVTEEDE